jgi:ligand-binding sensor domain-containing protein/DNA-binding CsgD family transcriptional regulator
MHSDLTRWLCTFLLAITPRLSAQIDQLSFDRVFPQDDLNQNYFLSLSQDNKGYLWLGTYSALYRYDGYTIKTFVPSADTNSISNPAVHCIFQDREGFIWFGTEGGLNQYDPKTEKFHRIISGAPHSDTGQNHIKSICQDNEGILWIGTYGGGLNSFNIKTGKFKIYKNKVGDNSSLSANRINSVYVDKKDELWIGTELGGLCHFNKVKNNFERYLPDKNTPGSLTDDIINTIYEDSKGRLWIGTWRAGLNLFNRDLRKVTSVFNINHNGTGLNIRAITEDNKGNLWLGTFGTGLFYLNPNDLSYKNYRSVLNDDNSISSDFIWSLFNDKSDILWIGTSGNGLNKLDENRHQFPCYRIFNNSGIPVTAVFSDSKGNLWMGSKNGIFAKFDTKSNTCESFLKGKISGDVTAITGDKNNNLWIGTGNDGLVKFNPQKGIIREYKKFNTAESHKSLSVTAIYCDTKGNLWFSLYDNGLYKINSSQLNNNATADYDFIEFRNNPNDLSSLSSNIVLAINEDMEGNIWLATDKFIDKLDENKSQFEHFGGYTYSCIYPSGQGILWIGTYGRGVARFNINTGKLEYLDKSEGLIHDVVNGIVGDETGNIWITTVKGISKYNPSNNRFLNFNKAEGLQGNQFLHNSCCILPTGELVFGGTDGFNIFQPTAFKSGNNNTHVIISDIKLFNKSITLDTLKYKETLGSICIEEASSIELNYKDKVFSIEFETFNFSTPEKQKFQYKLEGFDKDWVTTDALNRFATYTNLDDGKYEFRVRTINPDGTSNSEESHLKISIKPPIYKTALFKMGLLILLICVAIILYRRRVFMLREKYLKLQMAAEQELIKVRNQQLDSELEFKNRELITKTMNLIHKNEKIQEIRNNIFNILPEVKGQILNNLQFLLKSINKEIEDDSNWDQFEFQFNQTHDHFLKRFKETYPLLTHNDLKICAYMRMNLQNHEIAALLNISVRTVETNRYRIRKKISLDSPLNLTEFILRF